MTSTWAIGNSFCCRLIAAFGAQTERSLAYPTATFVAADAAALPLPDGSLHGSSLTSSSPASRRAAPRRGWCCGRWMRHFFAARANAAGAHRTAACHQAPNARPSFASFASTCSHPPSWTSRDSSNGCDCRSALLAWRTLPCWTRACASAPRRLPVPAP